MVFSEGVDTHIDSESPEATHGETPRLWVRETASSSALLRFDLGELPANATILGASLELYLTERTGEGSLDVEAYRVLRPWRDDEATWSRATVGGRWTLPGACQPGSDRDHDADDRRQIDQGDGAIALDVTQMVQYWAVYPDENEGVIIHGAEASLAEGELSSSYAFASFEHATTVQRPRLVVEYVLGPVHEEHSIELLRGANLISLPLEPDDPALGTELGEIIDAVEAVWSYDANDTVDPWKVYVPGRRKNDLLTLDHRHGYWIEMREDAILTVSGMRHPQTRIPLSIGWNLVGYPQSRRRSLASALDGVGHALDAVWRHDVQDAVDPWKLYSPSMPTWAQDLSHGQPGEGYWILVSEECELRLP